MCKLYTLHWTNLTIGKHFSQVPDRSSLLVSYLSLKNIDLHFTLPPNSHKEKWTQPSYTMLITLPASKYPNSFIIKAALHFQ